MYVLYCIVQYITYCTRIIIASPLLYMYIHKSTELLFHAYRDLIIDHISLFLYIHMIDKFSTEQPCV